MCLLQVGGMPSSTKKGVFELQHSSDIAVVLQSPLIACECYTNFIITVTGLLPFFWFISL